MNKYLIVDSMGGVSDTLFDTFDEAYNKVQSWLSRALCCNIEFYNIIYIVETGTVSYVQRIYTIQNQNYKPC